MAPTTRRQYASQEPDSASESNDSAVTPNTRRDRPQNVRFTSKDEVYLVERYHDDEAVKESDNTPHAPLDRKHLLGARQSPLPDSLTPSTMMYRVGVCLLLLAAALPLLPSMGMRGHNPAVPLQGVSGGPIPGRIPRKVFDGLDKRANTQTDVCFRWAQQCKGEEDYYI